MNNRDFNNTRHKPEISPLIFGKVPPQAPELEAAVLGALMLEKDAFTEVYPILPKSEAFYDRKHEVIYGAIIEVVRRGNVVDMLTVTEQLIKAGKLEEIGGAHYLAQLCTNVVSSAHIKQHSAIIVEKYILREIIRVSGQAVADAYDNADPFELLGKVGQSLHEISNIVSLGNTVHISKVGKEVVEQVDKVLNGEIAQDGVTSKIRSIDAVTGGWQKTDLIILAARPAVGKTAFVLNMIVNCGVPALVFSLEMGKGQFYKRIVSNTGNIPLDFINRPERMNEGLKRRWHEEYQIVSKMPIYINDKAGISITEMTGEAKKYKRKYGIQLIAVDYLQLIRTAGKKDGNREQEVAYITRELKVMAKELEVPVIALSQLNRAAETGKPTLANLRESGAIEQDADLVMFLYCPDVSKPEDVILDIAKHRNGTTRDVALRFEKAYQRFKDDEAEPFVGTQHYEPHDNPSAGITRGIDFKSRQANEKEEIPLLKLK